MSAVTSHQEQDDAVDKSGSVDGENNTFDSTLPPDEDVSPSSSTLSEGEAVAPASAAPTSPPQQPLGSATPTHANITHRKQAATDEEVTEMTPPSLVDEPKTFVSMTMSPKSPVAPVATRNEATDNTSEPNIAAAAPPKTTPEPSEEDDDDDEDSDSSNDDSSYFRDPRNLPDPKSERRYSWASTNSAPPATGPDTLHGAASRESDASLSFSEDSDDGGNGGHHHHHSHSDPMLHTTIFGDTAATPTATLPSPTSSPRSGTRRVLARPHGSGSKVTELFPQRITRMHSYSSLVGSDDVEEDDDDELSSDPSVRDELRQVGSAGSSSLDRKHAAQQQQQAQDAAATGGGGVIPSGRISPILGEHAPSRGASAGGGVLFSSPSSVNPQPSPPTIMPFPSADGSGGDPNDPAIAAMMMQQQFSFPHPQPHHIMMSPEQMHEWMTGGHAAAAPTTEQQQQPLPRSVVNPYNSLSREQQRNSNRSMESTQSGTSLVYSTEEESERSLSQFHVNMATGGYGSMMATTAASGTMSNGANRESLIGKASGSTNGFSGGPPPPPPPPHHHHMDPLQTDQSSPADSPFATPAGNNKKSVTISEHEHLPRGTFKVYWQRWIMLMYMSVLNLLSDWTCYSVAPIALLTEEAFGQINPELLVVVFLGANAVASACEPIILSRLGLRRTVLFGALLLMMGSIIKSGGMPPIIQANLEKGKGEWRVYLGFFLVGLSQPLYQCTPALLSASWFPERERTMATGVALNANQLGIGFAFVFGTLLVANSDDIPGYFGLLSIISTIAFLGTLIQFDDAPPTPPSDTARVMKGTMDLSLPGVKSIFDSVRNLGRGDSGSLADTVKQAQAATAPPPQPADTGTAASSSGKQQSDKAPRRSSRSSGRTSRSAQRRSSGKKSGRSSGGSSGSAGGRRRSAQRSGDKKTMDSGFHGLTPSPARWGKVAGMPRNVVVQHDDDDYFQADIYPAPSPMNTGPVGDAPDGSPPGDSRGGDESSLSPQHQVQQQPNPYMQPNPYAPYGGYPYFPPQQGTPGEGGVPPASPGYPPMMMMPQSAGYPGFSPPGMMPTANPEYQQQQGEGAPPPGAGYPMAQQQQQQQQSPTSYAAASATSPESEQATTITSTSTGFPQASVGPPAAAGYGGPPGGPEQQQPQAGGGGMPPPYPGYGYPPYPPPVPYWDPRYQAYAQYQQQLYQMQVLSPDQPPQHPYYGSYQFPTTPSFYPPSGYEATRDVGFLHSDSMDEGVEPVLTVTDHHLDINIRDDQVILSIRTCLRRPGFVHALVAFTVSGIVINTLSTYMDYLVRLNGAGREYTGIVGGSFQAVIMVSSLIIGKICDKTRAYYSITIGMLVVGAFGLAECGVSLTADRGTDLRWSLVIVALLVGPLQPVSTELGVEVVYPLSENTVLVIQQLFSNLLSAAFIPCFKAMKDMGIGEESIGKPEYTFSFYLLIVLHAAATVFFATFNGRYLRYEHELEKKAQEERRKVAMESTAFHRVDPDLQLTHSGSVASDEMRMPLLAPGM